MSHIDSQSVKKQFPMLIGRRAPTYLDSAASSQTPTSVVRAVADYYGRYRANVHRGLYPASEKATERFEEARDKVAGLLGADRTEIVFTHGSTESLNLLAYSLSVGLQAGDEILLTVMEHHSNLVPWQQLAKRLGLAVKFIGLTGDGQLDLKQAEELLASGRVRVVSAVHLSNAFGTVLPVERLAELAHQAGAKMIVDAAQSVGHRPISVGQLGCDFLAFSGHKMFGPTGIGVLYGRRQLLEELPPFLFGGDMISRVSLETSDWNELPWKFEAGTPNIAGAIGLGAAVDFIDSIGLEAIQEHEDEVTQYAVSQLGQIEGLTVYGPPPGQDRGGLVSFGLAEIHPHDLTGILGSHNICVRGGHHCAMPLMEMMGIPGTTRASFSVYSSRADVDRLVEAVKKAKRLFGL